MKRDRQKHLLCVCSAIILCLCQMLSLAACGRQGVYTTSYFDTFDTVLTVTIAAPDHATASAWSGDIHGIALRLHQLFSIYETFPDTVNLKSVNDRAGEKNPATVDAHIMALLSLGKDVYDLSQGKVNIMMGAVLSQWHKARTAGDRLPDETMLRDALQNHVDMASLVVDKTLNTVLLTNPSASLDVGAIAKGYVLEQIRLYAMEQGITSMLVNFGGQVMAMGKHPDGNPWTVAIRNPADGSVLDTVAVENAVVTTSADDQRTFSVDGVAYHHIIHPDTGYPATFHRTVTVILPIESTLISDGLSTALFLSESEEIPRLLDNYPESAALWMDADGTIHDYRWKS